MRIGKTFDATHPDISGRTMYPISPPMQLFYASAVRGFPLCHSGLTRHSRISNPPRKTILRSRKTF